MKQGVVELRRECRWECPNCDLTDVTHNPEPHSRMHICPGAQMMTVPMVPAGTKCKIELEERQDYVGDELVQYGDDGVPYTNAITMRDEGYDNTVYAPTAKASVS